jgi:hypothetical protein
MPTYPVPVSFMGPDVQELPMTLDDAIQTVIAARQQYHMVHAQVQQLRDAWARQYAALLEEEVLWQEAMRQAETALRTLAVERYQATGHKSLAPGVKIREVTRLQYDPQDALTWAMEHRIALTLDVKAFEQLAKVARLPFVQITVEPQATLTPCFKGEHDAPAERQEIPYDAA